MLSIATNTTVATDSVARLQIPQPHAAIVGHVAMEVLDNGVDRVLHETEGAERVAWDHFQCQHHRDQILLLDEKPPQMTIGSPYTRSSSVIQSDSPRKRRSKSALNRIQSSDVESYSVTIKNDMVENARGQRLNEYLTRMRLQAIRDVNELASMTEKSMGRRALSLQTNNLAIRNISLEYDSSRRTEDVNDSDDRSWRYSEASSQRKQSRKKGAHHEDGLSLNSLDQLVPRKRKPASQLNNSSIWDVIGKQQSLFSGTDELGSTNNGVQRQLREHGLALIHGNSADEDTTAKYKDQHIRRTYIETLRKMEEQKRLGAQVINLRDVFSRTRSLIERLWEEMHISQHIRNDFSRRYFYPETKTNYSHVFREITFLFKMRGIHHRVLANVEMREAYIARLKEIGNSAWSNLANEQLIVSEVPTIIAALRMVTVDLVESIVEWRRTIHKQQEFLWDDGENYIQAMKSDLDFLKLSELGTLFDFSVTNNPLLLPPHLRWDQADITDGGSDRTGNDTTEIFQKVENHNDELMFQKRRAINEVRLPSIRNNRKSRTAPCKKRNFNHRRSQTDGIYNLSSLDARPFKTRKEIRKENESKGYLLRISNNDHFVDETMERLNREREDFLEKERKRTESEKLQERVAKLKMKGVSVEETVAVMIAESCTPIDRHSSLLISDDNRRRSSTSDTSWNFDDIERDSSMRTAFSLIHRYPPHYFAALPSPGTLERMRQAEKIIFQEQKYKNFLKSMEATEQAAIVIQCFVRRCLAKKYIKQLKEDQLLRQYNRQKSDDERVRKSSSSPAMDISPSENVTQTLQSYLGQMQAMFGDFTAVQNV